ncbi:methyl-accepting chemotaxis protein [Vibrio sp. 404]|uniref:Methyl-accepting chemotaxis protein n=1 Tax=Vibrio marinisediminis TaxID=2758441 RepID=A0A7W2IUC2_9VIBR|nr:methyl-accepting chemotaxis protein [Vibrio marinisediminis]MBA5763239.1 methyl-accepting chemotaxis protein [Vibrio marinisediminis]
MKIKTKLYLLGAVAVVGIGALLGTTVHFAQTTDHLNHAIQLTKDLEIRLLNLRRNEKDFLLRSDLKYLRKFDGNMEQFANIESQLSLILQENNLPSSNTLKRDILAYQEAFSALVNAYQVYGLGAKKGLLGEYNQAIFQEKLRLNSDQLVNLIAFDTKLKNGQLDSSLVPAEATSVLKAAQKLFTQKTEIGLEYNQGLLGKARTASHTVETQFKDFSQALNTQTNAEIEKLTVIKHSLSILVTAIIILFIVQISRSIITKIDTLLRVIREIANNNDISLRAQLSGNDELSSLSFYFDELLDKLEKLLSNTKSKSHQLYGSTANMHNELESVIQQFQVQADHTTTMATSVQQMVTTIGEISESTSVAAEGVQQASVNAESGRNIVVDTVENITQLSERLSGSQISISSLNHHVDKIGDAVNIIQEIAEQTNLLALNAAIEAARAGEQGRGFAVVADEVRALASRTHQSTTEITNVVNAIQNQMGTVMSDIDQCNEQGKLTLTGSEQLDQSLAQILSDMHNIQANSERIASAIEEQGAVMAQVGDSITELNTISDSNTVSAKHCLVEVDKVAEQASDMDKEVAQYKTSS